MSEIYRTFDEWKEIGFMVNVGEKHIKRRSLDNKCLFSHKQVTKIPTLDEIEYNREMNEIFFDPYQGM